MKDFKKFMYDVFPTDEFIVEMPTEEDDPDENPVTINIASSQENSFCTIFTVYKKEIAIRIIEKCGISGSNILKKIEEIARLCFVDSIFLEDQSQIDICRHIRYSERSEIIDFAILKIVTTGQSWYNKFGYKSDYYDEEFMWNNEFINNTLYSDFINQQEPYFKEEGAKLFPDIDINQSVKSYFNDVFRIVKCGNHDQAKWLSDILDTLKKGYIAYNRELTKTIDYETTTHGGSKKKRKSRRTRRRRSRSTNRRKKN